jgi:lipoyl(octanoyl) transferase
MSAAKFRFIISPPANGPQNMAIDEALFNAKIKHPQSPASVRIYTWDKPCITIGYFQKHNEFSGYGLAITRRMTGGLSVVHNDDVSFSFIVDDNSWKHVYNQEKTYENIHFGIKIALENCGIKAEFVDDKVKTNNNAAKGNVCVQTFYPYDLRIENKKIAGSCQRRRGKNLLVQGSIHLPKNINRPKFYEYWETVLKNRFGLEIEKGVLSQDEMKDAEVIEKTKYSDESWSKKY